MNKFLKTLTAVAVVITLIACIGLLVACGEDSNDGQNNNGNTEQEYTYKFTVVGADGNPVEGMQVQLCIGESICKMPKTTDANGVVYFSANEEGNKVSAAEYEIHLLDASSQNVAFDGPEKTSVDQKDYTLTLTK